MPKRVLLMMAIASPLAFFGSHMLTLVNNAFMKPMLLVILIGVALYTYTKKNFGSHTEQEHTELAHMVYAIAISAVIGFYDGFVGPGSGSILILAFITFLGYDFLRASAYAKFVNLATNIGSIILFALAGRILYAYALPMAAANAVGGVLGARLAILRGNRFIRIFFLAIVGLMIVRFAYDVFLK